MKVIIYADGSKQLLTYSQRTKTFIRRSNKKKMSSEDFFGEDKLEIILNDNDVVTGEIVDQNTHFLDRAKKRKMIKT